MKRFLIVPAIALLAGCEGGLSIPDFRGGDTEAEMASAAPAEVAPAAPMTAKERLVAATAANGCVMSPATIPAIATDAVVGPSEIEGLITQLVAEGRLVPDSDTAFRVTTPECTT